MKHLKYFENSEYTEEFIFKCWSTWLGSEIVEELVDFTEEEYKDYKNYGTVWDEYKEKAIEEQGLEWELDEENEILSVSTTWIGSDEEIDSEGYGDADYDELENLAIENQGLEFEIIRNQEHPNYLMRKSAEKYNI